jgi:hypothetical protein
MFLIRQKTSPAFEKIIDSKVAERDMVTDIEFIKQIEIENKVINVKREYNTGSGKWN